MSDTEFVRKSAAVMAAAGYEANMKLLFMNAPDIFVRAIAAIYLIDIPINLTYDNCPVNKKTEFVLSELYSRTGHSLLQRITGSMISEHKDFRAIGVVVGVIYEEGQRLLMQRLEEVENMKNAPPKNLKASRKNLKKAIDKRQPNNDNNNNINNMINNNENDDEDNEYGHDDFETEAEPKSHEHISQAQETLEGLERRLQTEADLVHNIHKINPVKKNKKKKKGTNNKLKAPKALNDVIKQRKKERPVSAPAIGRLKEASENSDYRRGGGPDAVLKPIALPIPKTKPLTKPPPPPNVTYDPKSGRKIILSEEEMRLQGQRGMVIGMAGSASSPSGRSKDGGASPDIFEEVRAQLRSNMESQASIKPLGPTNPQWPGRSTGSHTEQWIKKKKEETERYQEEQKTINPQVHPPAPTTNKPASKSYIEQYASYMTHHPCYNNMKARDLVVSVEHCHCCSLHNTTLRHDEDSYRQTAELMLQHLCKAIHTNNRIARVGVTCFRAQVEATPNLPKAEQPPLRIGAFEVQVAYMAPATTDSKGNPVRPTLIKEVLHSKLASQRWPSKPVLEKRLLAFLEKAKVEEQSLLTPQDSKYFNVKISDFGEYPVGIGSWLELPVSRLGWEFKLSATLKKEKANEGKEGLCHPPSIQHVQWCYDASDIGALVWISDYHYEGAYSDVMCTQPVLGIVVNVDDAEWEISIKYTEETATIPIEKCQRVKAEECKTFIHNAHPPASASASAPSNRNNTQYQKSMPLELHAVLSHVIRMNAARVKNGATDNLPYGVTCRKQMWLYLREWVAEVISTNAGVDKVSIHSDHYTCTGHKLVKHEVAWSEDTLDWIFTMCCIDSDDPNPALERKVDMQHLYIIADEERNDYDESSPLIKRKKGEQRGSFSLINNTNESEQSNPETETIEVDTDIKDNVDINADDTGETDHHHEESDTEEESGTIKRIGKKDEIDSKENNNNINNDDDEDDEDEARNDENAPNSNDEEGSDANDDANDADTSVTGVAGVDTDEAISNGVDIERVDTTGASTSVADLSINHMLGVDSEALEGSYDDDDEDEIYENDENDDDSEQMDDINAKIEELRQNRHHGHDEDKKKDKDNEDNEDNEGDDDYEDNDFENEE